MSQDRPKSHRPGSKISRIWKALRRARGLNVRDAFLMGETSLYATIAALRRSGHVVVGQWETINTAYGPVRFKRFRARLDQPK